MALAKLTGVDCTDAYNRVFTNAYHRCARGTGKKIEPHFVRDLISHTTVQRLNRVSQNLYDENINAVRFRATFLHGSPYAKFSAGNADPRVELADGMFVVYVTEPAANGIHVVKRRAACMLMVKSSGKAAPTAFSYDPVSGRDPVGTDESQFYLFNRWPQFDLETGHKNNPTQHGTFDIALPPAGAGPVAHDIGKFGVLWDHKSGTTGWPANNRYVHWLAGEPTPNYPISTTGESLGKLLEDFVDGVLDKGRDFDLAPANPQGWDALMRTLLGYPIAGPIVPGATPLTVDSIMAKWSWGGKQPRDVNPLGLGFLTHHGHPIGLDVMEAVDTLRGTINQHARQLSESSLYIPPPYRQLFSPFHALNRILRPPPPERDPVSGAEPSSRFPVLIATVSRFDADERGYDDGALTLKQRANISQRAYDDARFLRHIFG